MNSSTKSNSPTSFQLINSIAFISFISILGLASFVLPKQKISENEKRRLATFPLLTKSSFFSGAFMDSIDIYYSDHFPWRDAFINSANFIAENKGFSGSEIQYYNRIEQVKTESVSSKDKIIKADSAVTEMGSTEMNEEAPDPSFETIKSVVVYEKRAIQMFGGSKEGVSNYSKLINRYKTEMGAGVNVYCMPVPVGSDFYLPQKINKLREKEFITNVYASLSPDVKKVYCYEELSKHKNEYIQFNTDHHWTGRGAYYAYIAFCKSAGIEPLSMSAMTRKVIPGFLGTLYFYTLSKELKKNIDSVEYFKVPLETKAYCIKKGSSSEQQCRLYVEYAKGSNAYGVFLGGDYPLMRITSGVNNNRKALILKDSYGNAFAPYLTSHFKEVYVIDFRYYNGNLKDLVSKNQITDIIFAHNVYAANSSFTVKRELSMLGSGSMPKSGKEIQKK